MIRILIAAALAAPLTASLQAQSLADVARKAEEQRARAKQDQPKPADTKVGDKGNKGDKPATKVYTNNDLAAAPTVLSAPAADADKKSGEADKKPSTTAEPARGAAADGSRGGRDEATWRRQMAGLRSQLAYDESDCRAKEKVVTSLVGMMNAAGGFVASGGQSISADLGKARADQQNCAGRVAADKKRIADVEEDARVNGVPPGWLR